MRRIILTIWSLAIGLTCAADIETEKDRLEREASKLLVDVEQRRRDGVAAKRYQFFRQRAFASWISAAAI